MSEWDGTEWSGSVADGTVTRLPQRASPLSFTDWVSYFNFGANQYGTTGFSQTLQGTREDVDATFQGLVEQAYKTNGIVFACMRARQALFSEARFRFRRVRNGKPGDLFGNADLAILEEPWAGATTGDLLARAIQDVDLAGNAFNTRRSGTIRRLRPDWVTMVLGSLRDDEIQAGDIDADFLGIIYHPGGRHSGRTPVTLLREEFSHWAPVPDPTAMYRGMSWLTPVVREIAGDSATTNHKLRYFENGATPNLAITLDPNVTLQDAKEWIALFEQNHEGALNAYKTLFLGGGSKPVPVGSDLSQIDFKSVQGAGETRIAAAAGVPPIIVGLSEGLAAATYSNYGQARRAFADLTMRPLWRGFAGSLAQIINVPSDAELWYDDADISFLQEDVKDAAEIIQMKVATIGQATRDGFTPESSIAAIISGDLSQLVHTGLFSVQLQPPGMTAPEPTDMGTMVKPEPLQIEAPRSEHPVINVNFPENFVRAGDVIVNMPDQSSKDRSSDGDAVAALKAAIALHEAHMDGTEPTDDASQQKLMDLMMEAFDALDPDSAAAPSLRAAIALHEAHMNGTEPTSDASQQKMMDLMRQALAALGTTDMEPMRSLAMSMNRAYLDADRRMMDFGDRLQRAEYALARPVEPPVVNIPPAVITVNIPEQPAPSVTFSDGAFAAPSVNFADGAFSPPSVTVQPADVRVDVAATEVVVNVPEPKPVAKTIERDDKGQIIRILEAS